MTESSLCIPAIVLACHPEFARLLFAHGRRLLKGGRGQDLALLQDGVDVVRRLTERATRRPHD